MNSICIIANGYPTKDNPEYAFIKPVAHGFADNGISCTVIAPQSRSKIWFKRKKARPEEWFDRTDNGNTVRIIQPKVITISLLKIRGVYLSSILVDKAIKKTLRKYKIDPEVFYGHFWECGIIAAKVCNEKPVIVACGESDIWVYNRFSEVEIKKLLPRIKGVICVSTKNYQECLTLGLLENNPRVIVLPNGFNRNEFYHIPIEEARKKLGIDPSLIIASFVGAFIERKGVLRLVEAARAVPNLKLFLIGSGDQRPNSDQILFQGKLPHEEIVTYLNASNVFVLPTLAEGCCNAIVEAMACGLPIISSNLSFNDDILDDSNSIRINPNNVSEITNALISICQNDYRRAQLSEGSLKKAEQLSIDYRIREMIRFIFNINNGSMIS